MAISDSNIYNGRPSDINISASEACVYDFLDSLKIDYITVQHPAAFTMEECETVRQIIKAPVFKNLFLTNKQHSAFYLLLMPADKLFKTKYLSSQLGCARLSFASDEEMNEMLGVQPGSVTPLGLIYDKENRVRLIIDEDLKSSERYACHPCVNTASVGLKFDDLLNKVIPGMGHGFTWVNLPAE